MSNFGCRIDLYVLVQEKSKGNHNSRKTKNDVTKTNSNSDMINENQEASIRNKMGGMDQQHHHHQNNPNGIINHDKHWNQEDNQSDGYDTNIIIEYNEDDYSDSQQQKNNKNHDDDHHIGDSNNQNLDDHATRTKQSLHDRDPITSLNSQSDSTISERYDNGKELSYNIKCKIRSHVESDYKEAMNLMNKEEYDFILIQHQFSIYPRRGWELLPLMDGVKSLVFTMMHSSYAFPSGGPGYGSSPDRYAANSSTKQSEYDLVRKISELSNKLVVMSYRTLQHLKYAWGIEESKIVYIPHGVIDVKYVRDTKNYKEQLGLGDHKVIFTFGLLYSTRGMQYTIEAMKYILEKHPDAYFIIAGRFLPSVDDEIQSTTITTTKTTTTKTTTTDSIPKSSIITQRESNSNINGDTDKERLDTSFLFLQQLANDLGISQKIRFIHRFLTINEIIQYMTASDIYIAPYLEYTPVTSSVMYAMAIGRPVVSTKHFYAQELLEEGRGVLTSMENPRLIAKVVSKLLSDHQLRHQIGKRAYSFVHKNMPWKKVAFQYFCMAQQALDAQDGSKSLLAREERKKCHSQSSVSNEIHGSSSGSLAVHLPHSSKQLQEQRQKQCIKYKKESRSALLDFNLIRGFDERVFFLDMTFSENEMEKIVNLITDPFFQWNARVKQIPSLLQSHRNPKITIVTAIGIQWSKHQLYADAETRLITLDNVKLLYSTGNSKIDGFTILIESIDGKSKQNHKEETKITFVKENYKLELIFRSDFGYSWIDAHVSVPNDYIAPHGILGQSARIVNYSDRIHCPIVMSLIDIETQKDSKSYMSTQKQDLYSTATSPGRASNAKWSTSCVEILIGKPLQYEVKDGMFGSSFFYNMFLPSKTIEPSASNTGTTRSSDHDFHCNNAISMLLSKNYNFQQTSIVWEGPQLTQEGLSLVNRELCIRLAQLPFIELSIHRQEKQSLMSPYEDARFTYLTDHFDAKLSKYYPDIIVRNQWPPDWNKPENSKWVNMQPWEFGILPKRWVDIINENIDEVWIPTHYVKQCYVHSGVRDEKVIVLPHGVDTNKFKPGGNPLAEIASGTKKKFKFLFRGGLLPRKGIDILLDAYLKAFTRQHDVVLIIQSVYGLEYELPRIKKLIHDPNSPEIMLLLDRLSEETSVRLYASVDCLVHPHRSEGFGLPIIEAMASALPVIVTGQGASVDFCSDLHCYMIPSKQVPCTQTPCGKMSVFGEETEEQPAWAEPDSSALSEIMKYVYLHPEEAKVKGHLARQFVSFHFQWERFFDIMMERIQILKLKKDDPGTSGSV